MWLKPTLIIYLLIRRSTVVKAEKRQKTIIKAITQ